MSKQSTIIFRTLGPNGVAQALHLLRQQGFVGQKSLRVVEAEAGRVDLWNGMVYEVYPYDDDRCPISFPPIDYDDLSKGRYVTWYSGQTTPAQARAFALALLKAADLADEMDGGDDAKKSDV